MSVRARSQRAGQALVAVVGALFLVHLAGTVRDCNALRPVGRGDPAPDFELPMIADDGSASDDVVTLSALRGQVVILDFFATWCGPCQSSMPMLEGIARAYRDRGVIVLSINVEGMDRLDAAHGMARELLPSATLAMDDGTVATRFRVTTIPHMVVVDAEGVVREVHRGYDARESPARLQRVLDALVD